jgi:hypothetical protein
MQKFLAILNPAVKKQWLQLIAGLMWFGVGIMLITFASRWLNNLGVGSLMLISLAGLVMASAIYFFGFSKLARNNINRINAILKERVCLFAFQRSTSYPLIDLMIFLGIFLRLYSSIPKPLLAILYMGIGGGLLSSSLLYYRQLHTMVGFEKKEH